MSADLQANEVYMLYHEERLNEVEKILVKIIRNAVKNLPFGVLVVCGYRNNINQLTAYLAGKSKAKPGQSMHNKKPSRAVDLIPTDAFGKPLWESYELIEKLNKEMQNQANIEHVKINWAKYWKKFVELDHWELG